MGVPSGYGATRADLQRQLEDKRHKHRQLEDQFKKALEALERQLQDRTDGDESRRKFVKPEAPVKNTTEDDYTQRMSVMRRQDARLAITPLEGIRTKAARIWQQQESEMTRIFRARLQDASKELESQRSKEGDASDFSGSTENIENRPVNYNNENGRDPGPEQSIMSPF